MLYILTSFTSFIIGVIVGYFGNNIVRRWAYQNKLFGIDSRQTMEQLLVIIISVVWFTSTFLSIFTRNPVDPMLHGIFGSVVGAYFGSKILKDKNK